MNQDYYQIILEKAEDVFQDQERARDWMQKHSATLGAAPQDLTETTDDVQKVLMHLKRIDMFYADE